MLGAIIVPPCMLLALLSYPCDMANIRDEVNARHIALTADGLRYVVDKHPTGCRLQCQDEGRSSQTVPYDKITSRAAQKSIATRYTPSLPHDCVCSMAWDSLVDFRTATATWRSRPGARAARACS